LRNADLSGLGIDEEYEAEAAQQDAQRRRSPAGAASRPAPAPADAAHLTSPQPAAVRAAGGASSPPQPPSPVQPLSSRWTELLDGAKGLLDNLIDLGSSDDDAPAPRARHPPPRGGAAAAYPAVSAGEGEEEEGEEEAPAGDTTPPSPLHAPPGQPLPPMSEPSGLMDDDHVRALAAEVPSRYRQCSWELAYSSRRDGISLHTLLRRGRGRAPTVLVVRDMRRHVFGAYCSEPWRVAPRYFGTGETFVFQLSPRAAAWHWWWRKMGHTQNDFFQWGEKGAIAVGGAGGYALWLDEELARGLSRGSTTFGNDSLASGEEFAVGAVELWALT
jgi:hypothetical protein